MTSHITVVVPLLNEAEGIEHFYHSLRAVLVEVPGYEKSILFVVDGGSDNSFDILKGLAQRDSSIGILKFSRNFGHQAALVAGIDHTDESSAIIMMDSDMQHPPELIPALIAEYEKGNNIVFTEREEADSLSLPYRTTIAFFYWFVNLISDVPIHRNASDFRLISPSVARVLREQIRERNMFMRGIMSWVGFQQSKVMFKANERFAGTPKYSFIKRLHFAIFGIISFSKKPLRAATFAGIALALFGFVFAIITIVQFFVAPELLVPGWATVIVLLSIFGGAQLFFLGVLGEYVGAIFDEVKARPQYIVEERVNIAQ